MGWVGSEDERALEQDLVEALRSRRRPAEVGGGDRVEVRVLEGQPEAEEVRGLEGDVGFDRPLPPREIQILGVVVADTAQPPEKRLDLRVDIEARGRRLLRAGRRDLQARGGIERRARRLVEAPGLEPLAGDGEERLAPALGGELVLGLQIQNRIRERLARRSRGDGSAELERAEIAEVQERPQATGEERIAERSE